MAVKKLKVAGFDGVDSKTIRVSEQVYLAIIKDAKFWREAPDAILRRKYGIAQKKHWATKVAS